MATLSGQTIANTFDSLLHVEDDTAGLVATATDSRVIQDGVGANSALALATDSVRITSTNKLYFNDVGGEYISGDGTDLTITSGNDIVLSPTGNVSFGDNNITNVGDISLDSISSDAGTSINVVLGSDAGDDFTVDTNKLVVEGDTGNVGIGVVPNLNFNLQRTGTVEARFRSTDGDCSLQISSDTDEGQNSELAFLSGTSGRGSIVYDHNTTAGSQKMQFLTGDNAVTAMTIDGSGNVGIGVTPESWHSSYTALELKGGAALWSYNTSTEANTFLSSNAFYDGSHIYIADGEAVSYFQTSAGKHEFNVATSGLADGTISWTTAMTIDNSGNVGIGDSSPDAHLKVEDTAISTTATYTGFKNAHTKTAGATDASDHLIGLDSAVTFNDGDAYFAELFGGYFETHAQASAGESTTIYGIYNRAQMSGSTDVNNFYGSKVVADVNGGTVDSSVYGQYIDVDVESGCTLSDHVQGLTIKMDADTDPAGDVVAIMVGTYNNQDYSWRHYDYTNTTYRTTIDAAGVIEADGAITANAWDYAEYFESKDGNPIAIGVSVKLDGDKIVPASAGDTPLGVIRPPNTSTVVGNCAWNDWNKKYMTDDYDAKIMEDYTLTKWSEEITFEEYSARGKDETGGAMGGILTDSKVEGSKAIEAVEAVEAVESQDATYYEEGDELPEGKEVGDVKTEAVQGVEAVEAVEGVDEVPDTYFREHKYHSDRLPDGVSAPDDAEVIEIAKQRQKLNPDFDESMEYSPREERDEWHIVGLLGQIPITKGQPTGNWIKMKDVSDTVEMYFVK